MAALFLAACPLRPSDVCDGGVSVCELGVTFPYKCNNFWGSSIASCEVSLIQAHSWCAENGGGSNAASELDCYDYGSGTETGGGTEWDPGSYVTSAGRGVYWINSDLVDGLKRDFTIMENDSTILVESGASEYFQLSGVAVGDLADVLGLQTGDILLSVNGQSLNGIEAAIDAYDEVESARQLALSFSRQGTTYTYYYNIH